MELKNKIARIFCIGCPLFIEDKMACCTEDGIDKFCNKGQTLSDKLFSLRSDEGYRLAIVKDSIKLIGCRRTKECPDPNNQPCETCKFRVDYYEEIKEDLK